MIECLDVWMFYWSVGGKERSPKVSKTIAYGR